MSKSIYPFVITIDDKYSKYKYELELPEEVSIYDIIKVVTDYYKIPQPEGQYIPNIPSQA